jgi:hypothetical protein
MFLEKLTAAPLVKKFFAFMKPEGLLPYLKQLSTGTYQGSAETSSHAI